jgi:signal transduction histidine kinase
MTRDKERVERSMREKQRLLSVVCHDIANAVTVLDGNIVLARMLKRSQAPTSGIDLDRMGYACGNIAEIIGSVRMIEAVEQGRLTFVLRPVDLQAVFQNAQALFAERLVARNMRIQFPELDGDARFVLADPAILANQVFNNIISNSIKFSHKDSDIAVTVTRGSTDTAIAVVDHGIGMSADLLESLFDLDAQTTRPGTEGEPGTGFGLRTVKSFVDLFGGTMQIDSRAEEAHPADHGTTVTIRLKSSTEAAC